MQAERPPSVVSTGVAGLDNVLLGGFLRGGFYLVQGDPGSGKTTLALQFVQERIRAGERCLYISLTESRADLENACLRTQRRVRRHSPGRCQPPVNGELRQRQCFRATPGAT